MKASGTDHLLSPEDAVILFAEEEKDNRKEEIRDSEVKLN